MNFFVYQSLVFVRTRRRLASGSRDELGFHHLCFDLRRPYQPVIIDVELLSATHGYTLDQRLSFGCTCNPVQIWTKLEVLAKLSSIPVHVLLRKFLRKDLTCRDFDVQGIKSFERDPYQFSFSDNQGLKRHEARA